MRENSSKSRTPFPVTILTKYEARWNFRNTRDSVTFEIFITKPTYLYGVQEQRGKSFPPQKK